jgi:four helix bundle protein
MAKITKFEDIESWKRARRFTNEIYRITNAGKFSRDFVLRDQIRRAAISILSNIAEGFERGGDNEFLQFLSVAKASCGEERAQLYIALDQEYISLPQFDSLSKATNEVSQLIAGLMKCCATRLCAEANTANPQTLDFWTLDFGHDLSTSRNEKHHESLSRRSRA